MSEQPKKVWDPFIRIFHWSLVAAVGFCWWSGGRGYDWELGVDWNAWHERSAYLVLALIGLRIVWGLVGTPFARFKSFLFSPAHTIKYSAALLKGKEETYLGHNPVGALGVFLLLILCLAQATTDLFATDEIMFNGPLNHWVSSDLAAQLTRIHKWLFNVLLTVVGLHVAGVLYHQIFRKEKLIQAMFTGKK